MPKISRKWLIAVSVSMNRKTMDTSSALMELAIISMKRIGFLCIKLVDFIGIRNLMKIRTANQNLVVLFVK